MCRRVNCHRCKKITWAGCGAHVDSVMRGVAQEDICRCDPNAKAAAPAAGGQKAGKPSWWPF